MANASSSRIRCNQLWLNPVIGGFCIVAANFLFGAAVHRSFSDWFVLSMTVIGCVLLILGALSVRVSGRNRAKILCYALVAVGLAMAAASVVRSPV